MRTNPRAWSAFWALCLLLLSLSGQGAVRISEFLAENDGGLRDEDGDSPDWIELQNDGPTVINLEGWFLTDDAGDLRKWRMPAVNIAANGFLVVFASGKDRTNAVLHTNFQLDNAGEYLALIQPDGVTVAHAFAPAYPRQRANISFGPEAEASSLTLVGRQAAIKVLVPTDSSLGDSWLAPGFNDSAWLSATTAVGFANSETNGGIILQLDMGDRGQNTNATLMPGWSLFTIDGTSGIITDPTVRTYGSISVTLSNTLGAGYDDVIRSAPGTNSAFNEYLLLRDCVFSRSRTDNGGLDLALEGLAPNSAYAITVWSFESTASGQRVSDWFANGALVKDNYTFNGQSQPTNNAQYQFTFEVKSDELGRILVSARRDASSINLLGQADYGVFLNALQVAELNYGSFVRTDLSGAMHGVNASAYIRVPFTVADSAGIDQLHLRMKYNDGFVAYLNGQLIALANAPANPAWNATATAVHGGVDGVLSESFMADAGGALQSGLNVLAIQGLNISAADNDFLILPELEGQRLFGYFATPTPGAANRPGSGGVVADTRFSVDRGFFEVPFTVAITTATEGATIWYSFNGSRPSPTNGFLYSAPITISNTAFLRAAAYKSGYIPSDVDTHTYIFLDAVLRQPANPPGYPATWQAGYPGDYGMDSNVVNDPKYGATIRSDLRSIPTLSIVSDHNGLWHPTSGIYPQANTPSLGEREASAELIAGSGATEFAIRCGVEMHGNASRDNVRTPKHSMRLVFKSEYGPTKLRYDWFGGGVDAHDSIALRSCGFVDGWAGRYADTNLYTSTETGEVFRGLRYRPENTCYLRDVWTKESHRDMGWDASRTAYVHLYINGLYWGLYQPSERFNASYFQLLYGGHESMWDVIVGEDNNGPPVIVDGSGVGWTNVLNIVNAGITNEAAYQAVAALVDIDSLIDYMMVHIFAESEDWPRHNWYVARRREINGVSGTKFICLTWDQELTLDRLVRRNRINAGNATDGERFGPGKVYSALRAWPEFRRQFGDRIQKHMFNGGALTPSNCIARLLGPATIIRDALVGESARWGDARKTALPNNQQVGTGVTFTRDEWWQPEIDKLVTNFLVKLTADNVARFRAGNLYPTVTAPNFNQLGGAVADGFGVQLAHTNAAGVIYFTTDGTDPRVYGSGAVSAGAQGYSEPVILNGATTFRARVLNGTTWSALVETTFYPPQDLGKLALTEIMFNPPAMGAISGDELEFVELKNTGTNVLDLSGLTWTGINFTFTNRTKLAPGAFIVLARHASSFALKYPGVPVHGVFSGRLDNGGEALRLVHALGTTIFGLTYDDEAPWPAAADNHNFSIVPVHGGATQAPDRGVNWRASTLPGGSPGADDPAPAIPAIVINEVLSASVPPMVDAVELFNPTAQQVDVSGWFLTDDLDLVSKYRIPEGTRIAAGGFVSFSETELGFALDGDGERIYLFSANINSNLTGYSHGFAFGAAADDVSFGRYINSVGEEQFPAQISRSPLAGNAGPRVGPIVINEIHYHPAADGDEFIELLNISSTNVPMFDPTYPDFTWRLNGASFSFPTGMVMPPGGYLLIVATNIDSFRAKHGVAASVPIVGRFAGTLQDSGERIKLERPGVFGVNGLPFISVDEVRYNDKAPWPPGADGGGPSLQRRDANAYGDDPINWVPSVPTPGAPTGLADSDGDGLPDEWETANGTDPLFADANADPDGDGVSNLDEFRGGTDPRNANSYLKLLVHRENASIVLSFQAGPQRRYVLSFKNNLNAATWTELEEFPPSPTGGTRVITDDLRDGARFYRLLAR